ncbi:hypothetical protein F991_00044 [Acinetobacter sp. CIP-A165]|uniref:hypothetical protein n=1 Tax=Acinetobacter sp. CIP-A165 TaxID=40373 RepID=UPI0002CE3D52|nr:hypothetical protein [Acinetobacter sp. CIP-A165]ENU32062.1 hypothetical protein F991_00044 [Acinetobacter sp. CIP-A165]
MKKTLKRVFKTTFLVQIMGILIIPLIYLSFSENDFAAYGLFFSISAISSIFITGRLENLFFSIKNYKKLYTYAFNMALLVGGLGTLCLLFFNQSFYAICIFCGLSIGLFNLSYNYLVRENKEIYYNKVKIFRAILELLSVVAVCFFSLEIKILFLFISFSYFFTSLFVAFDINIFVKKYFFEGFLDFKYNFKYVLSDFFSSIFNSLYIYLPTIYFYFNGNISNSANYFLILKIFGVPTLMIAQSISTVIRQYAAEEFQKKNKITDTYSFFKSLYKKMLFPFLLLLSFTFLFFYLLDSFYIDGIFLYSVFLVFLVYVRAIYNTISSITYIFKWQHLNLKFQACLFFVSLLALMLKFENIDSIHFYSLFSLFVYISYMYVLHKRIIQKGYL